MIYQSLKKGNHNWEKQNLVTISSGKGGYDILHCKCGLKGKTKQLGTIELDGRQKSKALKCPLHIQISKVNKQIEITNCTANGHQFKNITPKSIHTLIEPPSERTDKSEFWVQGIGEPVRLLTGEFNFI